MFKRFLDSVDYRFWVLLAFCLGVKIAVLIGVLSVAALAYLGISHSLVVVVLFLPAAIWVSVVFRNFDAFSRRVKSFLQLT